MASSSSIVLPHVPSFSCPLAQSRSVRPNGSRVRDSHIVVALGCERRSERTLGQGVRLTKCRSSESPAPGAKMLLRLRRNRRGIRAGGRVSLISRQVHVTGWHLRTGRNLQRGAQDGIEISWGDPSRHLRGADSWRSIAVRPGRPLRLRSWVRVLYRACGTTYARRTGDRILAQMGRTRPDPARSCLT